MKRLTWTIRGVLGLWGLLGGLAIGSGAAQAAVIFPVNTGAPFAPDTLSSVTVSIFQGVEDVTGTYLPEPNQTVTIVVNGLSSPTISLVFDAIKAGNPIANNALTTSAYPGTCTNFGSDTGADFTLLGSELRSNDCGGMAVILVTGTANNVAVTKTFILPQDSDFDGIPDIFEAKFCAAATPNCLVRDADIDTGPLVASPCCDGISNFDEYRGFIVSGKPVRGDPKQKDLFLHLVNPADSVGGSFVVSASCSTSCLGGGTTTYPTPTAPNATLTLPATAGTLGAIGTFTTNSAVFSTAHVRGEIIGNAAGRARIVAVTSSTSVTAEVTVAFGTTTLSPGQWKLSESLFAAVYSLAAPDRVHLLGYAPGATSLLTNEWVDNFVSLAPPQTLSVSDPVTDRTVNRNRLYGPVQRGVRAMEGLNTASTSVLGWSFGVASPNEAGNIIVFIQRIINKINGLITDGGTALVRYSTFVNGAWTTPTLVPDGDPNTTTGDGVPGVAGSDVRNFILSKAIQFYLGMEVGHSLDLTPTVMGTQKTSYGYHYAPFTGDCLDQAITTKLKSGFNTFYIPAFCGSTDQSEFLISP